VYEGDDPQSTSNQLQTLEELSEKIFKIMEELEKAFTQDNELITYNGRYLKYLNSESQLTL
jgi:hypothetical protein